MQYWNDPQIHAKRKDKKREIEQMPNFKKRFATGDAVAGGLAYRRGLRLGSGPP